MMLLSDKTRTTLADRRGFVMPMVLFALMIMGTMAVVAINVSVSEHRSSRAVRTSLEALLAGITGLNEIQADWNDASATLYDQLDTLSSGGTIQIDWTNLASGASYKGEVMRIDNGGQQLFLVTVDGRDGSGLPSERAVTAIMTLGSGLLTLGACCDAAAYVKGDIRISSTFISGTDVDPPSSDFGQTCGGTLEDKPALISDNEDHIDTGSSGYFETGGVEVDDDDDFNTSPPVVIIDNTMSGSDFEDFGALTWQDVQDSATQFMTDDVDWGGNPVTGSKYNNPDYYGPRVHSLSDPHGHAGGDPLLGTCDTGNVSNFGYFSGPCVDFFPVIEVSGQVHMNGGGYAQGLVVMVEDGTQGAELDLEDNITFSGIILGRGCVEIQDDAEFYGSVMVTGDYFNPGICDGDEPLFVKQDAFVQYSSCVIQSVLASTGLGQASAGDGGGTTVQKLGTRWFAELIR